MEAQTQTTTAQTAPPPGANGQAEQFQFLPIEWLRPSKTNPRKHFGDLSELVDSVRAHGVLTALLVRPMNGDRADTLYEIIAGERRYRASKEAKLSELPVRILELDDKQALELQLIENLQRADVHPIEEADGYQALIDKHGYDVDALAARVGKSVSYVYQRLKLAALIPKAKEAFLKDEITASHAIVIARLADSKKQKEALAHALGLRSHKPSVRDFQNWVHEEFYLDLHGAPWAKDDAALVPAAGSCLACPKRSGFAPALFPELAKGRDFCQDANCFRGKQSAFLRRTLEADPELKAIAVGHLSPHERKPLEREFGKLHVIESWEIVRKKRKPVGAIEGIVVYAWHGATVGERVCFVGENKAQSAELKRIKAETRRRELAREQKQFARHKLRSAILDAVPPVPAERELRLVAGAFFRDIWHDLRKQIAAGHGIKAEKGNRASIEQLMETRLETWGQAELSSFLMELAIARDTHVGPYDGNDCPLLTAAAKAYGIDPHKILAAGVAECRRLQKARKSKKKPAPKAAKKAAKKKAAKGGKSRAPKTKAAAATA